VTSFQKKVLEKNPEGMVMSFLSNHDMDRIAGAFVLDNNMRMAANLYLLSPGSPVIYYGEEIGLRGSRGGAMTDANRRLAMLWGDGDPVRDPVGSTYPANKQISTTVKDQSEDEGSMLSYYRELISIRHRYPSIARGIYTSLDCKEKNLGGFLIEYEGEAIVLLHNTSAVDTLSVDLASLAALDGVELSKIGDYIGQGKATLKGTVLTLEPQTSVIIK
jgi:glycosidase